MTAERDEVLDFVYPIYRTPVVVYLPVSNSQSEKAIIYLKPFRYQVWLALAASIALATTIFSLFLKKSPVEEKTVVICHDLHVLNDSQESNSANTWTFKTQNSTVCSQGKKNKCSNNQQSQKSRTRLTEHLSVIGKLVTGAVYLYGTLTAQGRWVSLRAFK